MVLSEGIRNKVQGRIRDLTDPLDYKAELERKRKQQIYQLLEELQGDEELKVMFKKEYFSLNRSYNPMIVFLNSLETISLDPGNEIMGFPTDQICYSKDGLMAHIVEEERDFYQSADVSQVVNFIEGLGQIKNKRFTREYIQRCFEHSLETYLLEDI